MGKSLSRQTGKIAAVISVAIVISTSLFFMSYFHSLYGSSSNNLVVKVNLSSREIVVGANVTITVEVFNTGNSVLGLPLNVNNYQFFYSKNFNENNLSFIGPICESLPFGLGETAGDYGINNLSNGTPLIASPPVIALCPAEYVHAFPPSGQFMPNSYDVNIHYPFGGQTHSVMKGTITVSGFWANNDGNYTFHTFKPGIYTFVGEDGWGQTAIQHLTVIGAP